MTATLGSVRAQELLVLLLLAGFVLLPIYFLARAGYRRGQYHGTSPDSVLAVVLAFVFLGGWAALYWISRFIGARNSTE